MVIQVNKELCAGCGVCVDACSVGAIQLVEHWAEINDALCTQCEACIDACPNVAITSLCIPALNIPIAALPAVESQIVPVHSRITLPETASPARGIVPLAGTALTFLGREVVPRLVDVLATVLERWLTTQATNSSASLLASPNNPPRTRRGIRRQARYRGGHTSYRN